MYKLAYLQLSNSSSFRFLFLIFSAAVARVLLRKKKVSTGDEKKYFGLKNSIFHFVSIEVYTKWSLKKKYFEAFCSKAHKYLQLEKSF